LAMRLRSKSLKTPLLIQQILGPRKKKWIGERFSRSARNLLTQRTYRQPHWRKNYRRFGKLKDQKEQRLPRATVHTRWVVGS
jgi:hypothetical protein